MKVRGTSIQGGWSELEEGTWFDMIKRYIVQCINLSKNK